MLKIAGRTPEVRRERRRGRLDVRPSFESVGRRWQVDYDSRGEPRLQVVVDDASGRVLRVWSGVHTRWASTRPEGAKFGRKLNELPGVGPVAFGLAALVALRRPLSVASGRLQPET